SASGFRSPIRTSLRGGRCSCSPRHTPTSMPAGCRSRCCPTIWRSRNSRTSCDGGTCCGNRLRVSSGAVETVLLWLFVIDLGIASSSRGGSDPPPAGFRSRPRLVAGRRGCCVGGARVHLLVLHPDHGQA